MESINEGKELHSTGVKDAKGRDCGSTVLQFLKVDDAGKTFLTAYVHANRDGKDFCKLSGSYREFEIVGSNERAASTARSAWVEQTVSAAKERAAKRWSAYN